MSLIMNVYAVRINEVFAVFGNGDTSLVDRIRTTSPARYRIANWNYTSMGLKERGGPSVDETIIDIVHRRISGPDFSWFYSSALELICEHLGIELDNSEFAGLHEGLDEIFAYADIHGLAARLLSTPRYPIPIPFDIKNDPLISCLTVEEATMALKERGDPSNQHNEDGELTEQEKMARQFWSWVEYAVHDQTDLVCFYY